MRISEFLLSTILCLSSIASALGQGMTEGMSLWGKSSGGLGSGLGSKLTGGIGSGARALCADKKQNRSGPGQAQLQQVQTSTAAFLKAAADKEKQGRPAEAAKLLAEIARYREKVFNGKDGTALDAFLKAAKLVEKQSPADSEKYLRQALSICAKKYGPGADQSIPILDRLKVLALRQNKPDDAASFGKQQLALEERHPQSTIQDLRLAVADLCMQSNDLVSAQTIYSRALEACDRTEPVNAAQLKTILRSYAQVLKTAGKQQEADAIEERLSRLDENTSTDKSTTAQPAGAAGTPAMSGGTAETNPNASPAASTKDTNVSN